MEKFSKIMKKLFPAGQKVYKMPGVIILAVLFVIGGISEISKSVSSSIGYVPVNNKNSYVTTTAKPTAKKDSFTAKPSASPTADTETPDYTVNPSSTSAAETKKPASNATPAPTKASTVTDKPTAVPTKAPTPQPTSVPTPAPTPKPTPAPTKAPKQISLTSLTSSVRRNENVSISISGEPGVTYSITVKYPSGAISDADGLDSKTADSNGNCSWTWKIGGRTKAGTGIITISGGGQTFNTTFTVEE